MVSKPPIRGKRQPAGAENGESDLLIGEPLVRFFFGRSASPRQYELNRRRVYHLAHTDLELGIFHIGGLLAARRARLNKVFAKRETAPWRWERRPRRAVAAGL